MKHDAQNRRDVRAVRAKPARAYGPAEVSWWRLTREINDAVDLFWAKRGGKPPCAPFEFGSGVEA